MVRKKEFTDLTSDVVEMKEIHHDNECLVNLVLLHDKATMPIVATSGSSCFDIFAGLKDGDEVYQIGVDNVEIRTFVKNGTVTIYPQARVLIPTGLAVSVVDGFGIKIYPRSGLSVKSGINLINNVGIIDSDYRGEIKVPLYNNTTKVYKVKTGDRIAQAEIHKVIKANFVLVESLNDSDRGNGGFGSTGD